MNLQECFMLEDMFPKSFNSYDSNHAVIFRDQIDYLSKVLKDVIAFYTEKEIKPTIYQSTLDSGYFGEINKELALAGFDSWMEEL